MSGFSPKTILVPVDFSDFSFAAVDRAIDIAGDTGTVHVLHVMLPLSVMEPGVLYGEITDETRVDNVEKYLQERLSDANHAKVKPHSVVGNPGREIADFADRLEADLIVIPSHGHGFFKHLLLGSVAERVVRLARCPVLVLKSK